MHKVQAGVTTIYTTITSNPDVITKWVNDITTLHQAKQIVIIGLDAEGKGLSNRDPFKTVGTLQLCVENRCLIIQLRHMSRPIPSSLRRFLQNPRHVFVGVQVEGHVFVGVQVEGDAENLMEDYGLLCKNIYDLKTAALEKCPQRLSENPGLKELAREMADVRLLKPKHVTLSDWDVEVLSDAHIEYACLDAYASCMVGEILYYDLAWRDGLLPNLFNNLEEIIFPLLAIILQ